MNRELLAFLPTNKASASTLTLDSLKAAIEVCHRIAREIERQREEIIPITWNGKIHGCYAHGVLHCSNALVHWMANNLDEAQLATIGHVTVKVSGFFPCDELTLRPEVTA
jgi:hypothetical protein